MRMERRATGAAGKRASGSARMAFDRLMSGKSERVLVFGLITGAFGLYGLVHLMGMLGAAAPARFDPSQAVDGIEHLGSTEGSPHDFPELDYSGAIAVGGDFSSEAEAGEEAGESAFIPAAGGEAGESAFIPAAGAETGESAFSPAVGAENGESAFSPAAGAETGESSFIPADVQNQEDALTTVDSASQAGVPTQADTLPASAPSDEGDPSDEDPEDAVDAALLAGGDSPSSASPEGALSPAVAPGQDGALSPLAAPGQEGALSPPTVPGAEGTVSAGSVPGVPVMETAPSVEDTLIPGGTASEGISPGAQAAAGAPEAAALLVTPPEGAPVLSKRVPECAKNLAPPKGFLLIMSSHTGSTAIMSQLVQHPGVYWNMDNYEPLNTFDYEEVDPWSAGEWAREFFENATVNSNGLLPGFKLSAVTVVKAPEMWRNIARDFNLRIMWNYRANTLKRAVGRYPYYFLNDETAVGGMSAQEAEEDRCTKGVGCSFRVENLSNLHCVMVRGWRVDEYMKKAVDILSVEHGCYLELPYEDYLRYPSEQMNEVFEFLGLERLTFDSLRKKATSDNMCEVVRNYGELCAALAGCSAWSWMFDDKENSCSCANYQYESLGGDETNKYCMTEKPDEYLRWCGGFNYEEDVKRILELKGQGEEAMRDFKQQVLGTDADDTENRPPAVLNQPGSVAA